MIVRQARSLATEAALIDATIDLTNSLGVWGWTLRDVGRAIGSRNNSVCQYHGFRTSGDLISAAIDVVLEADNDAIPVEEYRRRARFIAHVIASTLSRLVLDHPKVAETIGTPGSPGLKKWAVEVLEEAFLDQAELLPGGAP